MKTLWDKGGVPADGEIMLFTVGDDIAADSRLIPYDIIGSIAHVMGLLRIEILNKEEAVKIRKALLEIYNDWKVGKFKIEPYDEDVHTALERALIERLGDLGKKVHTGRSRNDQVLTDLRLMMKRSLLDLMGNLAETVHACCDVGDRYLTLTMPGYTHMRRAMPTTVAFWYASFADSWSDALEWGRTLYNRIDSSPLGAAAGFGVPLPLDREYTARLMGFDRVQINAASVQNSRGRYEAMFINWLVEVGRDVEKLAWDLLLFSTDEYGFVKIPDTLCTGSSIMPQKKNPDVLELLRAAPSVIKACRDEVEGIISKLPGGYHRDLQLTKGPLLRSIDKANAMFSIIPKMLVSVKWDEKRLAAACDLQIYATHRAMALVTKGVPFREAYGQAAAELSSGQTADWNSGDTHLNSGDTHFYRQKCVSPETPETGLAEARKRADTLHQWTRETGQNLGQAWDKLLSP